MMVPALADVASHLFGYRTTLKPHCLVATFLLRFGLLL